MSYKFADSYWIRFNRFILNSVENKNIHIFEDENGAIASAKFMID